MRLARLQRKLRKRWGESLQLRFEDDCLLLEGEVNTWEEVLEAASLCHRRHPGHVHLVNHLHVRDNQEEPMRLPPLQDQSLEGEEVDVLVIGGGISGTSILRELTKWKIKTLLVDKESDVALHASGRNDGMVHAGIDLKRGSLKHRYIRRGNRMYEKVAGELGVPFIRRGQYVTFFQSYLKPLIHLYAWKHRWVEGIDDTVVISGDELRRREPHASKEIAFAMANPSAGVTSPYGMCIAYAENAIQNGAKVSLNTAVLDMELKEGKILSVMTNRGRIYPKLVVNAAGTFAEDIAKMAGDQFYSIHPRKGTNTICDPKAVPLIRTILSWKDVHRQKTHSKGGGIVHTGHDTVLVGPDAIENPQKEDFSTEASSIASIYGKHSRNLPELNPSYMITYFSGQRAATFEEDYVLERGRRCQNLIHCAGIQSPGLTTAPAVAEDLAELAIQMLEEEGRDIPKNPDFNPRRTPVVAVKHLNDEERNALIQQKPDYGIIICRCEEISKGEILDALRSPLCVPTIDGIKKRVRPGMGRCQGGFCMPLVSKIISEELGLPLEEVYRTNARGFISYGPTKGRKEVAHE